MIIQTDNLPNVRIWFPSCISLPPIPTSLKLNSFPISTAYVQFSVGKMFKHSVINRRNKLNLKTWLACVQFSDYQCVDDSHKTRNSAIFTIMSFLIMTDFYTIRTNHEKSTMPERNINKKSQTYKLIFLGVAYRC